MKPVTVEQQIEADMMMTIADVILQESTIHHEYGEDLYVNNSDEVARKIIDALKEKGYGWGIYHNK